MYISTSKGDLLCQTKQELADIIRTCALNPYDDIWISQTANMMIRQAGK